MSGIQNTFDQYSSENVSGDVILHQYPALRDFAARLASVPDSEFLEAYCLGANELFEFDHFCVGRMNIYSNMMRTVCYASDGKIIENMVYALADTPCQRVVDGRGCVYPCNVADEYPRDEMLRTMNIEAYVGAPVISSVGDPLGIVTGMSKKEIENKQLALAVVEYFRERIAFLLEASETLERYQLAYSGAEEGYWDWDLKTGAMVVSESVGEMLGYPPQFSPRDLSALKKLVHPHDRESFISVVKSHQKTGEQFTQIVRMECHDSGYRWVRANGRSVVDSSGRPCRMIGSLIDVHRWVNDGAMARLDSASSDGANTGFGIGDAIKYNLSI